MPIVPGRDGSQVTSRMTSKTDKSLYALLDVPGKGKGLVATKTIPKGTRILSDEVLITMPLDRCDIEWLYKSIRQQVDALSDHQRQAFLSLRNTFPFQNAMQQYFGIVQTNAIHVPEFGSRAAVFLETSRINHACDYNSLVSFNNRIQRLTVHVLRDIPAGKEITISYINPLADRKTRQESLLAKWGFTCSCDLCSLPEEESQKSDERLEQIQYLEAHGYLAQGKFQHHRFY
ncbi:hypothetical protein E4U55_006150 [Claviceps digitariae]|nr:hypothetical protein E4U55_006150 [Claviceps digitariae]